MHGESGFETSFPREAVKAPFSLAVRLFLLRGRWPETPEEEILALCLWHATPFLAVAA